MDTTELVIKTLKDADKALKAGEIAEKAGIDKTEVDKAIKKLKKAEMISSPKNCFYEIKK